MKTLKQFCAAVALISALSFSALAGEILTPPVAGPAGEMSTPGASAAGDMHTPGVSAMGDILTPGVSAAGEIHLPGVTAESAILGFWLQISSLF
jgi:hypothetical protein